MIRKFPFINSDIEFKNLFSYKWSLYRSLDGKEFIKKEAFALVPVFIV